MQFCDACGSMMKKRDGVMVCTSCGQTAQTEHADAFVTTEEQSDAELVESSPDANFEGKPTADDVTCEACGHGTAWYTIKQTGSADEPPTRFFKCKGCGNRWREYS